MAGSRDPEAPGSILQRRYLADRLSRVPAGRFTEVGVGTGRLSRLLLERGWRGTGWELSAPSLALARTTTAPWLADGAYALHDGDWLTSPAPESPADLILSSMVLEHLDEADERRYLRRAAAQLAADGLVVLLVPASPRHWGIEDEIAGHFRRYTRDRLRTLAAEDGWEVVHLAGLTYPLSNALLGLSNALVRRAESSKRELSMQARTEQSGHRSVPLKTSFPAIAGLVLNDRTMQPWDRLQRRYADHPSALVLYCELRRA
jgi:SAM-dependent methyltransferase